MVLYWWRSPLMRARRAARSKNWAQAVNAYRKHLESAPSDAPAWVQLGHSLKEQGKLGDARVAYQQASRIAPDMPDALIHLAYIERSAGHREDAIRALKQMLTIDPGADRAARALVEMGARERLPVAIQERIEAREGVFAASRYGLYRDAIANSRAVAEMAPPPADVLAVIDARGVAPERLRELLEATQATLVGLTCVIVGDGAASVDAAHVRGQDGIATFGTATHLLLLAVGCRVEPDTIGRLYAAMSATGAPAAYCDHDHWEPADNGSDAKIVMSDPCFQPMFDPLWFRRTQVRPPCLLVTGAALKSAPTWEALFARRLSLRTPYVHVPLILASRRKDTGSPAESHPARPASANETLIQVVIQTRDAPDMLERCVASLRRTAARPERLDIVIVDNRSVLSRTAELLAEWSRQGIARVMPHDEPFNWARANNLATRQSAAPHILFLNNDVEMESARWDEVLRDGLAEISVGALGALLLYPDHLIQHAGVVFGMGTDKSGGPVHEGVGHPVAPGGPAGRWSHPRLSAAVTGAWLATSRSVFDEVGGFEEQLPVAYNDIDFCLRCRLAGRLVVETSHVVAVHRESATRGRIMSFAEQSRADADWAWMRSQWGEALDLDPAYNPNWARVGQPFDAFCMPSQEAISHWIAASAKQHPWSISLTARSPSA